MVKYDLNYIFFEGTNIEILEKALRIRRKVFIEEQGIKEKDDLDGKDERSIHLLVLFNAKPVGTARLRKVDDLSLKVERVAVVKEFRNMGIGKNIMCEIERYAKKLGIKMLTLDSQIGVKDFYKKLGYSVLGSEFCEAGILHVKMIKRL